MTYEAALEHARRLLPPDVYAAIVRGPRPAGGHIIGQVRPGAAVEVQRQSGAGDPRAEREPRERRQSTREQVAAIVGAGRTAAGLPPEGEG